MSIKDCIFITESYAHYNGREKGLSPSIDAARAEHEALMQAVAAVKLVCEFDNGKYQDSWPGIAQTCQDALTALERLK